MLDIYSMLFQCWASVEDGGPTLKRHWVNVLCLLGYCLANIKESGLSRLPVVYNMSCLCRSPCHWWTNFIVCTIIGLDPEDGEIRIMLWMNFISLLLILCMTHTSSDKQTLWSSNMLSAACKRRSPNADVMMSHRLRRQKQKYTSIGSTLRMCWATEQHKNFHNNNTLSHQNTLCQSHVFCRVLYEQMLYINLQKC